MKNRFPLITRWFVHYSLALMIATFAISGCASGPKRHGDSGEGDGKSSTHSGAPQNGDTYGPNASDAGQPPITYGPQPVQLKPVTLVFGPGMARSFAHVGVLRAFTEHKIPIGAIYGAEMGGLIGALYAADPNINSFEWNLLRLKDDIFTSTHSLIGRLFSGDTVMGDPGKLESELKKIFGKRDIAQARIPLRVEVQYKSAGAPTLLERGAFVPALRAAVASPGFFGPGSLEGQPTQAAGDVPSITYLCAEARAISGGPVVLIDTAVTRNDPSGADLVIRPNLDGIGPVDFSKKTDAAFRGKRAVEENLPELRRWVGLSEAANAQEGTSP